MKNRKFHRRAKRLLRNISMITVFAACGTASFVLGLQTVHEVGSVHETIAQTAQATMVNVILQVQPIGGGAPRPIEVTPFMNSSNSALLHLQEIHVGRIVPLATADRCRTTNSLGRCSLRNIPVGGDSNIGLSTTDQQYDILVNTVFLEFLTRIPLESAGASVRFDPAKCSGSATSFTSDTWCLTKSGANFAAEYFVTITLRERDTCTDSIPPAQFCDVQGRLVSFRCNPSFSGPTHPWEPNAAGCGTVQCPDGNFVGGLCADITADFSACSMVQSCRDHLVCSVTNFGSSISYDAGEDTLVIRGDRFGTAGGTVSFITSSGSREEVEIFPGADWTNHEIRVRIPLAAVSGALQIHPHTHGFTEEGNSALTPVTCSSPSASIRAFKDQFSILSLQASPPDGVRLVAPGYETRLQMLVRHNDSVGRLKQIVVELLDGSFPDVAHLPPGRTVIAQSNCPVQVTGSASAQESTLFCGITVPASAATFTGPFTFLVTLFDDRGDSERAILLSGGDSALAGDFTLNGIISLEDAVMARRLATGALTAQASHLLRDTDGDRVITMNDVHFVLHSLTE